MRATNQAFTNSYIAMRQAKIILAQEVAEESTNKVVGRLDLSMGSA
jgi:hypothetical protein